ncbi:T7SS effector LXG polymorphic toxin [Listeria innocua]|nr:hypothetical protein [Listeria innocua]EHF3608049.1 hypothetical protein [Listeria innocua]ELD8304709.1 hypothetical protein [Listeria innocua]ELD8328754.1 hypothetical protein [Listeria innocua]ELD8356371.1 hypothetical protein [Listeria innocua]
MTKLWHTEKFGSFHEVVKKFTAGTFEDLNKISKKQEEFLTTDKGMSSKTFIGAQNYVGEVHLSIIYYLNRALDEYSRVVTELEQTFQDTVDDAGNVKIETEILDQLNKNTDMKVEDVYQAHAELQKRISTCNIDTTCIAINGPTFDPMQTTMNNLSTQLNQVKAWMDSYDDRNVNAFTGYHQLIVVVKKAINSAATNYTGASGAVEYQAGAFGSSEIGQELSSVCLELEINKITALYRASGCNLNNMTDYANELINDPNRLVDEINYLRRLIENGDFTNNEQLRGQLTSFYLLLIELDKNKKSTDSLSEDNFKVKKIEVGQTSRFYTELNVSFQLMSPEEYNNYFSKYKSYDDTLKKNQQGYYLNNSFIIKHYGLDVDDMIDIEENAALREQMKSNNFDWVIPIAKTSIGAIGKLSKIDQAIGVFDLIVDLGETFSEDRRLQEQIDKNDLINTADKFDMTCATIEGGAANPGRSNIILIPTKESNMILERWIEVANKYKNGETEANGFKVEMPTKENTEDYEDNYLKLLQYYRENKDNWSTEDRKYIFGGGES